jgi:hypothetical protein
MQLRLYRRATARRNPAPSARPRNEGITLFNCNLENVFEPPEREARLHRAKVLGRIAYVRLRSSKIEGMLTYDREEKHLRKFDFDGLYMELLETFRASAQPTEYSSIEIRHGRLKVLEIRWDKTGYFKVRVFKPGDWERTLRGIAR